MKTQMLAVEKVDGGLDTYLALTCMDGEVVYLAFEDRALGRALAETAEQHNRSRRRTIRDSLVAPTPASRAGMDAQS